jgi:peptide/nickel transport system permease protein
VRRYLAGRILSVVPVVVGVTIIVFLVLHLAPGDPAQLMVGPQGNQAAVERVRSQLGLDRPLYVQYADWVWGVVRGDFGYSFINNTPVLPSIAGRLQATYLLAGASFLLSTGIGIAFGVISATHQYRWQDRLVTLGALFGVSMPEFWLGLVLLVLFTLDIRLFPPSGMYSPAGDPNAADLLRHLVLPAITLALPAMAVIARLTRSSMLEVLRQDYVQSARSKGLALRLVTYRHALSNALLAVVTVLGVQVGYLLGGTVIVETVFAWPGLGSLLVQGVGNRDFPVVQGVTLIIAVTFVLVNLLVDLIYGYLDPRVRLGSTAS